MNETRVTLENACAEFEADLVLYYYGEASETERQKVETHLKGCEPCGRFLNDLRGLLPQMSTKVDLPESFWDDYYREMVHKLDRERERKSWWKNLMPGFGGWMLPAFGTAMVVVFAVALIFGKGDWNLTSQPTQQEVIPQEILFDSSRLEFFKSLDMLESLSTLENMDGVRAEPAEMRSV
jgi:hypothetical protein